MLVASIYKAPSQDNKYFLLYFTNILENYSTHYEKVLILGDFNLEMENKVLTDFLQEHILQNMMKQNIGIKGNKNPCTQMAIRFFKKLKLEI